MLNNCWLRKYLLNFPTIISQIFKVFQNEVWNQETYRLYYFTAWILTKILMKSLKKLKKSIFCYYSKSDFLKSIEYMMLTVSAGCNTPLELLRNRISSSKEPQCKNAPCWKAAVAFLAVFGQFFYIHGTKYWYLGNTCWPKFWGVIIMV